MWYYRCCIICPYFSGNLANFAFGTEEQKNRYLPDLCTGKKLAAFGLTEPNAGTDAAGQQTTAVKDGDDYILMVQRSLLQTLVKLMYM